jgi:hypothetical protein
MRRRDFIKAIVGSSVAWPLTARAEQDHRVRRIGVLMGDFPENAPEGRAVAAAFGEELQKLGWTEGRNIRIDSRWALVMTQEVKLLTAAPWGPHRRGRSRIKKDKNRRRLRREGQRRAKLAYVYFRGLMIQL